MEEHCKNPWNKRCSNTNIVLYIEHKGENKPICAVCWIKIAKNTREWGEGDMRPPFDAKVVTDETGMAVYGKLRREDKKRGDKFYTWKENERRCSRCKVVKLIDEFYIKKSGIVNAWCKQCSKEYCRERRMKKLNPGQSIAEGLLSDVVNALGFQDKGYRVKVTARLRRVNGNAGIWDMFLDEEIRLIKLCKRERAQESTVKTILHEIAHFEQVEKAMIEDGICSSDQYIRYLKSISGTNGLLSSYHNLEFHCIFDELKEAYRRSTAAG